MDNQSILICLPLIFIQNERSGGFKRTSEDIGFLHARKHEYDNKKNIFFSHWEKLFRMYIFFEIDHLNSLQKKPAGYWLTQ